MNDTIYRQEAIVSLMREIRSYAEGPRYRDVVTGLKIAVMVIQEKVPSAQPTQTNASNTLGTLDCVSKTNGLGKWIEKEDNGYHGGGYTECSVCGQRYSWGGYFEANGFRYCPRCGHRMEAQE